MTNPHSVEHLLQSANHLSEADWQLATRYAPIIKFDAREPFLPAAVGYTIFRADAPSPSFPRQIELGNAALAIEYAVWWDWDIQHLYELEHVWVYLDEAGQVIRAEASWHGGYSEMTVDDTLPLTGDKLTIFSESGKHAFAPSQGRLNARADKTKKACTRYAGTGGVWITPLFKGIIDAKTPLADRLVHTYLERQAFEPAMEFSQIFQVPPKILVPWPTLFAWIPGRVAWWVSELERTILPEERRFLRIAHRGASAYAPENTLTAIAKAAELGADAVELDVHVSADGAPVIIHDAYLERSTNGAGVVSKHTLAQLKELDAGEGETIPTLEEAIACCRTRRLGIYLELKSDLAAFAAADLIRKHKLYYQVIVTSFRPDWLINLKAIEPRTITSVLFSSVDIDPVALARLVGAQYVHPAWEDWAAEPHKLLTPDWMNKVRAAGLGIITWHEERPSEIAALRKLGVDGICSNAPDLLI